MNYNRKLVFIGFSFVFLPYSTVYSQILKSPGTTGASFLKINLPARCEALSQSYCGLADDVSAIYYNPGGLVQIKKTELQFSNLSWYEGMNANSISFAKRSGSSAFGFDLRMFQGEDRVRKLENGEVVEGEKIGLRDLAVSMSYAVSLLPKKPKFAVSLDKKGKKRKARRSFKIKKSTTTADSKIKKTTPTPKPDKMKKKPRRGITLYELDKKKKLGLGFTMKYINEQLYTKQYSTFAMDIGIIYTTEGSKDFYGAALQNIGSNIGDDFLPVTLRFGGSYKSDEQVVSWELSQVIDASTRISTGIEFKLADSLCFRIGGFYQGEFGYTAGLGFWSKSIGIDYAYVPQMLTGFDSTHNVSLKLRL